MGKALMDQASLEQSANKTKQNKHSEPPQKRNML
jgi:hypothetical protein